MMKALYNKHMRLNYFLKSNFFFLGILFLLPFSLFASGVSLSAPKTKYVVGESVLIMVKVDGGGSSINTVSGSVNFSPGDWEVNEVRYGASIISLWVTKPTVDKVAGNISFVGGVPGGFNGGVGTLFTIVAKAKRIGVLPFDLKDIHVLLNDGKGTEMMGLKNGPLSLSIEKAIPKPISVGESQTGKALDSDEVAGVVETESILPPDLVVPEHFVPLVGAHPSLFDNAYFVSFSSVDKDSGIDHYEVREIPDFLIDGLSELFATPWKSATSPSVLSYQHWGTRVSVRAYDQVGNSVVETVEKAWSGLILFIIFTSITLLAVLFTRISMIKSFRKYKMKKRV
jgi:hypothetical protein